MTAANTNITMPEAGFEAHFEECVEEASFLWLLRSMNVRQPHCTAEDIAELESRIEGKLLPLLMYPESGWRACLQGLSVGEPGEVFVAGVVAFRSLDTEKIQVAVDAGLTDEPNFKALVSALAWLPGSYCHSWVKRFFTSKDLRHKRLAVAVCRARREDPCGYLTRILDREDCRADDALHAESLRAAGIFRRHDLSARLAEAALGDDEAVAFWALWAEVLVGKPGAPYALRDNAFKPGDYQLKTLRLAVRTLPHTEAKRWVSDLLVEHNQYRLAIQASGDLGDPQAVPWLISCMRDPALARIAGEAFSQLTGVDLEEHGLSHRLPDLESAPGDDPVDDRIGLDEDEHLPWPNSEKIAALWATMGHRFRPGNRYFLGRDINAEYLCRIVEQGGQRQRAAAAMELALLEPTMPLPNAKRKETASQ